MNKKQGKKTRKNKQIKNKLKQASLAIASVIIGQIVENLVHKGINKKILTSEDREKNPNYNTEYSDINKEEKNDLIGLFKDKIDRAVHQIGSIPDDLQKMALAGLISSVQNDIPTVGPEIKPKKSKKKKKKKLDKKAGSE